MVSCGVWPGGRGAYLALGLGTGGTLGGVLSGVWSAAVLIVRLCAAMALNGFVSTAVHRLESCLRGARSAAGRREGVSLGTAAQSGREGSGQKHERRILDRVRGRWLVGHDGCAW
jgi:hypothetical protein